MVNVLEGLSSVLVLAMTYISENHVSRLKVILCSTAAYIIGMVMLCISAFHPIPGDKTGMYFVPAVLLISVGKSGGVPILEGFLVDQLTAHERRLGEDEGRVNARETVWSLWWITASLVCALSTPWIFGSNPDWLVVFICSISVMVIGYLLFLCCIPLYHRSVDDAAATTDLEIACSNPKEHTINNGLSPAVCAGRSLVEQWKPLSVMIPMWTTFLVFGLVLSTGDTFFTEQGNNMDPTVSIYVLIMIRKIIRFASSFFTTLLLKCIPKRLKTQRIIVGIWTAMVLSIFCCSVAWRVEIRRLRAITEYGFCAIEVDYDIIPMSIMRLAPQFCLLALMEGIGRKGLDLFFEAQVSDVPMGKYGSALNEAVIGFGSFLNAVLVYGLKSWFGDTLNCSSRLDNYYQMLMIMSFVNLCYYWFVSSFYWNKKKTKDDVDEEEEIVVLLVV
ncbi:protein NRT1/ PTR FAMILY 5.5-like isoform X2 [Rhododendron vialii]|nr:protein NRT1/ PTR FAMILY 5.5-like isoform X2 [Rhododendron vialii]